MPNRATKRWSSRVRVIRSYDEVRQQLLLQQAGGGEIVPQRRRHQLGEAIEIAREAPRVHDSEEDRRHGRMLAREMQRRGRQLDPVPGADFLQSLHALDDLRRRRAVVVVGTCDRAGDQDARVEDTADNERGVPLQAELEKAAGRRLVSAIGGRTLIVPPPQRPVYHAAAVFAETGSGTAAGTTLVLDCYPGSGSSTPSNLVVNGATMFFSAFDGTATVGSGRKETIPQGYTERWKELGEAGIRILRIDPALEGVTSRP